MLSIEEGMNMIHGEQKQKEEDQLEVIAMMARTGVSS